ncbi:MAG: MarR family transcriptional regulator [Gammaproteobacteria bacterium]|nr:MAG: MarR family transcriptional regulator [Gammaproteobacteria bacterium]
MDTPTLNIQDFLPYRINLLAKRVSHGLSEIYTREFGITIAEWRTLLWLNSNDKVYAKDICQNCFMDKTQVSRVVSGLETQGLLKRETDERDQRSLRLMLTPAGKTLIEKIIPKAVAWEKALIAPLSEAQYQELFQMIALLEAQLTADD